MTKDSRCIEVIRLGTLEHAGFVVFSTGEVAMITDYVDFMGEDWTPGGDPADVACVVAETEDEFHTIELCGCGECLAWRGEGRQH